MSDKTAESHLNSLKDAKNFKDIDFKKVDLIRGETPPDIEEKCLKICKDYLSGNWSQQTVDTIEVRRITGGFVNQLYYCGIKEPDNNEKVPQEVAIKLYGKSLFDDRLKELVISLTFSEKNIGPKIYGLFDEGQIQAYYKFKEEEQKIPKIRDQVFKTLARIHSWEVPIKKDPNSMPDYLFKSYQEASERFDLAKEIEEYNCLSLKACDLKAEIDWAIKAVQIAESPVVFTHNDYRSSNLLITEPNNDLIACDFDVSCYGYRGYDFESLCREWGRNQFDFNADTIPFKDNEIKPLIEIYIKECQRIYGKSYSQNPINSVDHIIKEIKIFLLWSTLFPALYFMRSDQEKDDFPFNRKVSMQMADKCVEKFLLIKTALKEQEQIDY